jgi:hypothetical protein
MNRCHRLRSFIVFAVAIVATSANLSCQSTPAPISPGWRDYVGQLADVSNTPADPDLLVPLGCEYRVIVEEAFNTLIRTPAKSFVLERGGELGEIEGEPWIIGSSDGSDSYVPYYRTDPSLLQLRPQVLYELEFDYRIIDEPDQGFETIFYSPLGGAQNNWLPGVVITGPSGSEGRAKLRVRTNNFADYQIRWNVIGSGTIAIRNIRVSENSSGKVVATDSGSHTTQGPSAALNISGAWTTEVGSDGKTRLLLSGPATISTDPDLVRLAPGEAVMIEFAYTVTKRADELGRAFVAVAGGDDARMGIRFNGGCPDSGIFVGGGKQTRSFMYIDDCTQGIDRIMHCDQLVATPINLGSSQMVAINELVDLVEQIAGLKLKRSYKPDAPRGVAGRNSDNTFIKEVLAWEPGTSLQEGMEKTYHWIAGQYADRKAGKRTVS